ncbi:MAG TPA: PfkB family carbohydrate kinase [Streptosporangiaceae bacterium]|nr:PfkB family carbohydrate kinase [Streptosporangiaceae bacterium]
MIVTVTLNPALGVRYDAEWVALGAANQVSGVRYHAGGRGLTVARLLQTFGHEVVAAGLAGGSSGELIKADLARAGVATQFTRISAESRRGVRIADAGTGQVTTLEEPAPYITTEELGRLAADYRAMLDGATAVVLCGSLPAGLPAETYASLTSYAVEAGVPVILNADGSALRHGAKRQPALVIPEAGASESELMAAGAGAVVLLTGNGVRAVTAEREWHASVGHSAVQPATVEPATVEPTTGEPITGEPATGERATGRRDALVAGFVPGIALGWTWPDMLRHALALADSVTPDGEADLAVYEKLLPEVKVAGPRS